MSSSLPEALHVVVVLNWHGRSDTIVCVDSLMSDSSKTSVLVVDNGSFDGTLGEVTDRWEGVHTLQLPQNLGFSGGMNAGIRHAIDVLSATQVTILNNDTVVPKGAMRSLAHLAAEHRRAVSPVVKYLDEPDRVWFAGGSLDRAHAYPHHTAVVDLERCEAGLRSTALLAGCCVTARSQIWDEVGLFDDRFFLNFEDSEWSLRARAAGIDLVVACDVEIFHAVSASFTGTAATLGSFYFLRNGLLFNRIAGGSRRSRIWFIRRFGLGGLRHKALKEQWRALVVLGWAIACYSLGRFGKAPDRVAKLSGKWNTTGDRQV